MITIKNKSKGGSSNTHKSTNAARPRTQVKKRAHEWKPAVSTQNALKSLSNEPKRNRIVSKLLYALVILRCYSMAPRGSFYSPKKPMSHWFFIWEAISLPCLWSVSFYGWADRCTPSVAWHIEQGMRDLILESPEAMTLPRLRLA
jgi:hypothetical protein